MNKFIKYFGLLALVSGQRWCNNYRSNSNDRCRASEPKCGTDYYTNGDRVDAATNNRGICVTEDLCDVFTMDHYVPTADGSIPIPDDYSVFLCFERL